MDFWSKLWLVGLLLALVGCSTTTTQPTTAAIDPAPATALPRDTVAPTLWLTATQMITQTNQPAVAEPVFTASDKRWVGRSIYFIMTDRFSNGDPANDDAAGFNSDRADPRRWHGGDFRGIINQLDYIEGMGFDAIWITPVTRQRSVHAYHGYWQHDFYAIDPHFGTLEELKQLVEAAHERDMLVMLDVVPNHTGDFIPGVQAAPPFDDPSWFHNQGNIKNYGNQQEVEQGDLLGLDDIAQENPAARAELLNWIAWLRTETGVDGLRVDTAKHMPKDFLAEFDAAAATHSMAEVFSGDVEYVAPYSYVLDAVTDFPLYEGFKAGLATSQPLQNVQQVLARDAAYRNVHTNGTFIDNHDVERFMCLATGGPDQDKQAQLHQALAVLFTVRGIPIVYYGTEQQLAGCKDPANREDLFELFDPESPTYGWLSTLNSVRKAHPALTQGTSADRFIDANGWAFQRSYAEDTVVVCVNNSWQPNTFAASELADLPDGTQLSDALGASSVQVVNGAVACELGPRQVAVYTR